MKTFFISLGIVLLIVFGAILLRVVLFPAHVANQVINTAEGVVDRTLNAENVINNYEWFKQQYEDYGATKNSLQQAKLSVESFKENAGPRENWTFEDKTECSRLNSIVDGFTYQLKNIAAEYNAKSKMLNRNIFKDKNLPYQLEEDEY